jgi:3D (Asp-Asp-Asp) domain-containing protein
MTGIATSALVAFFVATSVGSTSLPSAWAATTPQAPIYPVYQVTLTGYNATSAQTDGDPSTTASGAYADPDVVAARSRDLADELPYGTVISITPSATSSPDCGYGLVSNRVGLRVIADTMNARMHNKVDILFGTDATVKVSGKSTNAARVLGVCKDFTIAVVGHIDPDHMPKDQLSLKLALGQTELADSK